MPLTSKNTIESGSPHISGSRPRTTPRAAHSIVQGASRPVVHITVHQVLHRRDRQPDTPSTAAAGEPPSGVVAPWLSISVTLTISTETLAVVDEPAEWASTPRALHVRTKAIPADAAVHRPAHSTGTPPSLPARLTGQVRSTVPRRTSDLQRASASQQLPICTRGRTFHGKRTRLAHEMTADANCHSYARTQLTSLSLSHRRPRDHSHTHTDLHPRPTRGVATTYSWLVQLRAPTFQPHEHKHAEPSPSGLRPILDVTKRRRHRRLARARCLAGQGYEVPASRAGSVCFPWNET